MTQCHTCGIINYYYSQVFIFKCRSIYHASVLPGFVNPYETLPQVGGLDTPNQITKSSAHAAPTGGVLTSFLVLFLFIHIVVIVLVISSHEHLTVLIF